MYKVLVPALLTASLVGCGSGNGDSAVADLDAQKDIKSKIEQTVPTVITQQTPELRVNSEPSKVYAGLTPHKVDSQGRLAPSDYPLTAANTPNLDPSKFVVPASVKGDTPQLRDANGLVAPAPVKGDTPQLRDANGLVAPAPVKGDMPQLRDANGLVAPAPVKGDTPQLTDENGLVAPSPVKGDTPQLTDENGLVAPPSVQGDTPQLRDANGLVAPAPVQGDTPQLTDENGLAAPALVQGDTPQLRDENGLLVPAPVQGDTPQIRDENNLVAPPELDGHNPGEEQYIAKLTPVGAYYEATTLDNLTILYSLNEANAKPELSISMQQVGSDYMGYYAVNVNGVEIELSNWVNSYGDNIELDLFPGDLTQINNQYGTQLNQLSDLIGKDDGVLRLVFGSHSINLQAEQPTS
ncbi:hypothetical protein VIN01S_33340 [Vibrio inusitatus NBRC 102082]|uniref:Lipoprotein n=1 Tax=Vibrio inusitatus NBRC 102082 TaxID=1219070 RepID=A0A4Y3I0M9_9VIBR|nr:hypothetical protein [Vibrio inusitatus]GEA52530.1 hypothetical protein VIN01S_33340 [Vibrio inusitatus NBRC 102082]